MAYLFQTFSVGQVLTAAQMNQVEVNIRDHQHGVAGVSSSGMTFVSPVFTTQITTPKIVTASGDLEITPVGATIITNAAVAHGMTNYIPTDAYGAFQIDNATNGGLRVWGVGDTVSQRALVLLGILGDADPTDTVASLTLAAGKKNGVNIQVLGNSETVLKVENWGTDLITILGSGNAGFRGVTSPTAAIHLPAGTTVASTAPLKFTSGSLLTTPEAGAVEFLTDAYYATITTGAVRKTFAFLESPVFTTPNIGSATGSISGNAETATTLQTARDINGVSFNGSANITVTAAAGTLSGNTLASGVTASSLTTIGTLVAGTVPLARMMRKEVQASGATSTTLDMLTVNAGDRILLSGQGNANPITRLTWSLSSGTATIDFMGYTALETYDTPGSTALNLTSSGICRVTGTGTLVLSLAGTGTGTVTVYGHAIVLNNG